MRVWAMHEHRLRGCAGSARGAHSHAPPVQPIHSTVRHARRARVQEGVGARVPDVLGPRLRPLPPALSPRPHVPPRISAHQDRVCGTGYKGTASRLLIMFFYHAYTV